MTKNGSAHLCAGPFFVILLEKVLRFVSFEGLQNLVCVI